MKKIKIEIKNYFTDSVLFEYESKDNTLKKTLDEAVKQGANLRGANLRGAKNLSPLYWDNLNILRMQKGKLRAFKYLNGDESPIDDKKLTYKVDKTVIEKDYDDSDLVSCSKGLNVATLEWCLREGNIESNNFIEVEFKASDIVAIPYNSDGKFRVKKLKVIRKIPKAELKKFLARKVR